MATIPIDEFQSKLETFQGVDHSVDDLISTGDVCEMLRVATAICEFVHQKNDADDQLACKLYNAAQTILETRDATSQERACLAAFRLAAWRASHSSSYTDGAIAETEEVRHADK